MVSTLMNRVLVACAIFAGSSALAHEESTAGGGKVVDFGEYHLAATVHDHALEFTLQDGDGKETSLKSHEGGSVTVAVAGGETKTTPIPEDKPFDRFSAPFSGDGKITATVKLKSKGKTLNAKFKFPKP